jgi:Zn-dependent peptidase ImmA (M78 family)
MFWSRMVKLRWTDHVKNEEALQRVKEDWNVPQTVKRRKVKLIGHTLRRNSLIKYVIEGNIEGRI